MTPDTHRLENPLSVGNVRNGRRSNFFSSLRWPILLFCSYGFFAQFKPSEANIVPYLTDVKHFNNTVVFDRIFPYWTYSLLPSLLLIALFAEATRYKPSMILGSIARVATRAMLIWGTSLLAMQLMQVIFGVASASEVIFYTYMFNLTQKSNYQKVTSYLRAASLVGYVFASFLGQILVSQNTPLVYLFYISMASECVAAVFSIFFPSTDKGRFILSKNYLIDIKKAYSSRIVIGWTVWFIFGYSVYDLVANYMSNVWKELDPSVNYNGFIVGAARLMGAAGAILPAIPLVENFMTKSYGVLVVILCTVVTGAAAGFNYFNRDLACSYASYAVFIGIMEFMIAVCYANIAKSMSTDIFATVFCLNTFVSVCFQMIVQLVVTQMKWDIYVTFLAFGSVQMFAALTFGFAGLFLVWPALWWGSASRLASRSYTAINTVESLPSVL